jgi:glycosyltransferase involved in cell wall biosynthesis
MIRIAQVVEAVEGGCKRHVLELAAGLDPARFRQTVVFSPRRDPDFPQELAAAGAEGVETIPWQVTRSPHPWADLRAYRALIALLGARRFDLLHFHSAKAGFLGRLAARRLPPATIYTPHCFPFRMDVNPLARAAYLRAERWAGRYTDRLIAVAPSEADVVRRLGLVEPGRVRVIENGIEPARFDVAIDRGSIRAALGLEPRACVVVCVGALRPQKGHRYLIDAVALLAETHPHLRALLVGDGPLRGSLAEHIRRRGVGEHVRLLGARDDVPALLKLAYCAVLPSLWEGGPYALLEAMAAGTPLVGSRIDGITDWVTEGETGRLARPRDPRSLARCLRETLADPAGCRRMAQAAREMVLLRNTRERWLREMAALYDELAGGA